MGNLFNEMDKQADDIMSLSIRQSSLKTTIKELETIAYHLRDTEQLLMANWMERCIKDLKNYSNDRV